MEPVSLIIKKMTRSANSIFLESQLCGNKIQNMNILHNKELNKYKEFELKPNTI